MLIELFEAVRRTFSDSEKIEVTPFGYRSSMVSQSGKHEMRAYDAPPRADVVETLGSLVEMLAVTETWQDTPIAYVSELRCVVVLNKEMRSDTVTLGWAFSPEHNELARLIEGVSHRELIESLRTVLNECVPTQVVDSLASIDWNESQTADATAATHGRAVAARVQGNSTELPRYLDFKALPLFDARLEHGRNGPVCRLGRLRLSDDSASYTDCRRDRAGKERDAREHRDADTRACRGAVCCCRMPSTSGI